jgi:hypothetical protein
MNLEGSHDCNLDLAGNINKRVKKVFLSDPDLSVGTLDFWGIEYRHWRLAALS